MSISVEKQKPASERFMLVRVEPRRIVTLVDEGADEFSATFPYPISKIVIDGETELTRVSTISGFDQFTHNEDTGALRLKYNDGGNPFHCVVYYYLFYTGTTDRAAHQDPEDTATTLRNWAAKILAYPTTVESFNDILSGVFSIQDTKLELINHNLEFSEYLTDNDSFSNAGILFWLCINSVSNIQKVFTGRVTSVFADHRGVVFQCANNFKLLEGSATMGRPVDLFEITAATPLVSQNDQGKLVPFVMGRDSYFTAKRSQGAGGLTQGKIRKVDGGNRAICASYSATKSKTTNRDWILCHTAANVSTNSVGQIIASDTLILNEEEKFLLNSISNVQFGDTLKFDYNSGGAKTTYIRAGFAGSFLSGANARNLAWDSRTKTNSGVLSDLSWTASYTMPSIAVIIKNGDLTYYPYYERDYVLTQTDMPGAPSTTKIIGISFNNNFEDNIQPQDDYNNGSPVSPGIPILDPDVHEVYFRITLPAMTHGTALKEMVNRAGILDDGNFNAGFNATIDAPVQFQIPNIDETYINTYRKYCEDILGGTIGYLRMNSAGQAEYTVSESPAPVSSDRDEDLILKQSLGVEVQYQDIATGIVMYNPHNQNQEETSALTNSPALSAENPRAKYLHLTENLNRLKHPFKYVDGIIDRLMGIYSNRRAVYSLKTATEDIETRLGDDITVVSDLALGSGEIKVTEVEKTTSRITLRGTDLLGIND